MKSVIIPSMSTDLTGLLAGYDITELRAKVRREPFREIFDGIAERVRETAERDRQTDVILPGGWCHSQYFTPMVLEAGFVYRMTGDEDALAHVRRQIDKLARVYADPPESFYREIQGFRGKPSAYFSNAHTCLAARLCGPELGGHYGRLLELARTHLLDDCHRPEYFFTHFNAGHNAVATHVISAAICALAVGHEAGYPLTDQLIEWGRDACEAHTHWGFDAQGAPFEGPMYALVTLEWVYLYADLLRRHEGEDLFRALPKLETIAEAASELQLPGLPGISGFQDCRRLITQHPMPWLLLTAREYGRPRDLALWRQTEEKLDPSQPHHARRSGWRGLLDLLWWDGSEPECAVQECDLPTAFFGEGTGVSVLRSSWRNDAVCLVSLGQGRSHNVPDHTHADAGHFSIYAHGDYLAYDTAYFNFDEDTHSVVLIDDTPHCPATQGNQHHGVVTAHGRHPLLDFVTVDAASAKGCLWAERATLFIRGEGDFAYVVTLDNINRDNDVHNFKWQLQANLHCRIETGGTTARVIGNKARLDCHFFNPLAEDFPSCPHALRVYADDHLHLNVWTKEPETNPRLVAEQIGPNCTLMAVLIPRRLDEPALQVTDATASRTFNAYVEHGDYIDQLVYACDHSYVRLPDLRASSEIVVVRRRKSGGVVGYWTNDGSAVRIIGSHN